MSFECGNSAVIYLNEIRVFLLWLEFWCKRLVFRRGSFHENRGSDSKLDIKLHIVIRIGIGIGIGIVDGKVKGGGGGYVCMYVCMVITYSRVWINQVRLPILLVVS